MSINDDSGGIAILVVAFCLGLLALVSAIGVGINAFALANKLNQTADRVALGAAINLISNPENTCREALKLAELNSVLLNLCEIEDDVVTVKVRSASELQRWLNKWPSIGMARAGIDFEFD